MIANTIHSAVGPGVVAVDAFAVQTGRRRAFDELHMHGVTWRLLPAWPVQQLQAEPAHTSAQEAAASSRPRASL